MKYKRLTKKETFQYKGKIYDLEVENVHSYNIDGLVVHNSGAGALLNYALDITQVDPMEYDLIFERFLNPKRKGHVPDIDNDSSYQRSDEIYDYINKTFGQNHCCNISTFQYMKPRAAIRDIARVFDIPLDEVDKAAKKIDADAKKFDDIKDIPEIVDFFKKYEQYHIKDYMKLFLNLPKSVSQHPAGIIIAPEEFEITDLTPVVPAAETKSGNTWYKSAYCKDEIEQIGGMKYDILRLRTMDIIYDELELINKYYNKEYHTMSIPINDEKTWDLICDAKYLRGVFQMDGIAAKPVIQKIKPRNMEELSAVNAFIRPGTSGLDEYCAAKKDPSKLRKIWPSFDKILAPTMGGIVYQEQVMGLIAELLGIDFGEADIFRRALEKPDKPKNKPLVEQFQKEAVESGTKRGIPKEACEFIAKSIIDNSAYLFNKSHSMCYSYISFWCAWVKANYPLVFFTVLFNNEPMEHYGTCMQEARAFGMQINPPDISISKFNAEIENVETNEIRMGLKCIKGLGEAGCNDIMSAQPFNTIQEFYEKTGAQGHNKKNVEVCMEIGAFDNVPLEVNASQINEDDREFFNVIDKDDKCLVYMNRKQIMIWLNAYRESNEKKSIPNYLVDLSTVCQPLLDEFDEGDLIEEKAKKGFVVVPENMLERFGKTIEEVEATRCKPKGIFKKDNVKVEEIDKFTYAFDKAKETMKNVRFNKNKAYIEEMTKFEVSFIRHPMEHPGIHMLDEYKDGEMVETGGIIKNIETRKTAKGKNYYRLYLLGPLETIRVIVWGNMYVRNMELLQPGNLIIIDGEKGFGGITAKSVKGV